VRWLRFLFVLYLAAVLVLTLWPSLDQTDVPAWAATVVQYFADHGIRTTVEFLEAASNVVMFLPFGVLGAVLLAHARRPWAPLVVGLVVAGAGFALSALIETVQLAIPGRVSTVQDVVLNGAGALLGALAVVVVLAARRGR
jgi:glycopeptide antibiotics resistance protein